MGRRPLSARRRAEGLQMGGSTGQGLERQKQSRRAHGALQGREGTPRRVTTFKALDPARVSSLGKWVFADVTAVRVSR